MKRYGGANPTAFSILERIVGVETLCRPGRTLRRVGLSVSSNGSLGLKLAVKRNPSIAFESFSILERIVGVETFFPNQSTPPADSLSVSSNGSLGLKLGPARRSPEHPSLLSVSSNGSLGLKHRVYPIAEITRFTFSILERIVGVETSAD